MKAKDRLKKRTGKTAKRTENEATDLVENNRQWKKRTENEPKTNRKTHPKSSSLFRTSITPLPSPHHLIARPQNGPDRRRSARRWISLIGSVFSMGGLNGKQHLAHKSPERFVQTFGEFHGEFCPLRFQPGTSFAILHRRRLHGSLDLCKKPSATDFVPSHFSKALTPCSPILCFN